MNYIVILAAILFCCLTSVKGQVSDPNNVPLPGNYVGFDPTSGIPLPIQNIGDPRINISSNGNNKFRITELPTWNGLNFLSRDDVQRTTMGLQGETNTAWSLLHLWSGDLTGSMQRDWMNVGTSYTANFDFMYTGLLERPVAIGGVQDSLRTDAVIAWGCQEGPNYPDNFRILFISPTILPGTPSSEQGRETLRIIPEGNVGIGNFSTNGLDEQPTHQLDVDGTARLRQMPNDTMDVIITGVRAEDPGMAGDYVLNYSTVDDFIDNNNLCDWNVVNSGADVATGYAGACVEEKVLIGSAGPAPFNSKVYMTKDYTGITLHVEASESGSATQYGGWFNAENSSTANTGIWASGESSALRNWGVQAFAQNGDYNLGVESTARKGRSNYGLKGKATEAIGAINFGVHGVAEGTPDPEGTNNVGVYGEAFGSASQNNFGGYFLACGGDKTAIAVYGEVCDTTSGVAGYFAGAIQVSQPPIALSDESVKTDISDIEGSLDIINQLSPKSYYYNNDNYGHLKLTNNKSYGFSAQEVQQILPDVVEEFHHPAKYDSTGTEISPSEDLLGIQYQEFIAILTAGIKEQQAQIDDQAETIDDLQTSLNNQNDLIAQMMDQMHALTQQVNNCCDGGELKNFHDDQGFNNYQTSPKGNVLNQNTPNPFRSQTTISYELETGGKVMLNIYDKNGKALTTLVEANQEAGSYRYEWDASGQPAGLYHYALYVDGELLVKKAIKLAD